MTFLRLVPSYVPKYPGFRFRPMPLGLDDIRDWLASVPLSDPLWRAAVTFYARRLRLLVTHRLPLFEELPRGIALIGSPDAVAVADAIEELGSMVAACDDVVDRRDQTPDARRCFSTAAFCGRSVLHALALAPDRRAATEYAAVCVVSGAMVQAAALQERGFEELVAGLHAMREIPRVVNLFAPIEGFREEWMTPTVRNLARVMYRDESWALAASLSQALREAKCDVEWLLRLLADKKQVLNFDRSLWIVSHLAGVGERAAPGADVATKSASPSPPPRSKSRPRSTSRPRF
ncbi:hypothetical protein [Limnoglobus roseus]|uniref:Uncharacterized protein n=1 Tax=Limnoglobus roseus TaxID=2598579 RepID=A0A5C1AK77_9BACT|nr:hypothetical protein [Limnoglobus roseus]QEL19075.1 hypothetical protein PX52LOC_06132 [Limnoglobus roseus]